MQNKITNRLPQSAYLSQIFKNYPLSLNSRQSNFQKHLLLRSSLVKGNSMTSARCAQITSSRSSHKSGKERAWLGPARTFLSSSLAISHAVVFKTEAFVLNTTKMWHKAQARHLFQQNVMFWSFSKMIFLFLKKVCGHGDESVNLRGTVCWVILKAVKFKNTWEKIIFLKYYFNFILWLSILFLFQSFHSIRFVAREKKNVISKAAIESSSYGNGDAGLQKWLRSHV